MVHPKILGFVITNICSQSRCCGYESVRIRRDTDVADAGRRAAMQHACKTRSCAAPEGGQTCGHVFRVGLFHPTSYFRLIVSSPVNTFDVIALRLRRFYFSGFTNLITGLQPVITLINIWYVFSLEAVISYASNTYQFIELNKIISWINRKNMHNVINPANLAVYWGSFITVIVIF